SHSAAEPITVSARTVARYSRPPIRATSRNAPSLPISPPSARPLRPSAPRPAYSTGMRFGTAVPIAAGATGRVVRVFDAERGEEIALKLLHRDGPDWVQRMLREAEVQMRLAHPNVCRVHGTGRMGEQPWIAMQLVDGPPLDEAAAGLPDRDKAALLAQVADA